MKISSAMYHFVQASVCWNRDITSCHENIRFWLGLYSLRRQYLIGIGIPIIILRRSSDRLRFIMGIPILISLHKSASFEWKEAQTWVTWCLACVNSERCVIAGMVSQNMFHKSNCHPTMFASPMICMFTRTIQGWFQTHINTLIGVVWTQVTHTRMCQYSWGYDLICVYPSQHG